MEFKSFTKDILTNNWKVYGVEVYENGELIHSFGDTNTKLHEIFSATKTILSIAVGIVWDRGLIDLEKSILEYLPQEQLAKISEQQIDTFKKITVHRLLCMSVAGFPFRPRGNNFLEFTLNCKLENPEIKIFDYSNLSAYLVGVALTTVLGYDAGKFVEENILLPLGINRYELGYSPEGYFYGASKMRLSVHDFSKIGLLLMNKGCYEEKRIVSEKYIEMATSVQQMNKEGGYGYFIWKYKDGYSISGKWKQKCFCLPNQKIMVSYLSHIEEDLPQLKKSMEKNILGINE